MTFLLQCIETFFSFQLERYFQKTKNFEETHRRRGRGIRGNGDIDDSSMEVSKDNSRASSVENDLTTDSKAWTEDDFEMEDEVKPPKRRGRKAGTKNGSTTSAGNGNGSDNKRTSGKSNVTNSNKTGRGNNNLNIDENSMDANNVDSNSSSPPPSSENTRPLRSTSNESSQDRKIPNKRGPPFGHR